MAAPVPSGRRARAGDRVLTPASPDPARHADQIGRRQPALWLAKVQVTLKQVVNDPEGLSIARALHQLGFESVESVRAGKYFEVEISAEGKAAAERAVELMCRRLLANPIIEEYRFTLARSARPAARRSPA